jgi:hypothetical protein
VALNGVQLPDVCINTTGQHEVFIIGDWGGVLSGEPGRGPEPADHRNKGRLKRKFVLGLDDVAQQKVAAQMAKRAKQFDPDYILNVGDNFYWGGVATTCCQSRSSSDHRRDNFSADQWGSIFEDMYTGPGLDGKQWLGVLGNHDYGGFMYSAGWDQTIMYSWKELPHGRPQRWVTPALYWRSGLHYPDFSVDYFFVDSNYVEALEPFEQMGTNICSFAFNPDVSCAAEGGPKSIDDCQQWFDRLWKTQRGWLEEGLATSAADWQVVVTHHPPTYAPEEWKNLTEEYGIDLMVVGHMHSQIVYGADEAANLIAPTVWVVSGGGGGITSDYVPSLDDPDDQYGFMHMTMSKEELRIVNIDHNGLEGLSAVVQKRTCRRCYTTTITETATTRTTATETTSTTATTWTVPQVVEDEGCYLRGGFALRSPGTRDQVENASAAALALALGVTRQELMVTASQETDVLVGRRLGRERRHPPGADGDGAGSGAPSSDAGRGLVVSGLRPKPGEWQVGYAYHAGRRAADSVYQAAVAMSRDQTVLAGALLACFGDTGLSFDRSTLAVSMPSKQARTETDLDLVALPVQAVQAAAGSGVWGLLGGLVALLAMLAFLPCRLAALAPGWSSRPLKSEDAERPGQDVLPRSHPVTPRCDDASRTPLVGHELMVVSLDSRRHAEEAERPLLESAAERYERYLLDAPEPCLPPAAPSEAEESERSLAAEPCLPPAAPSDPLPPGLLGELDEVSEKRRHIAETLDIDIDNDEPLVVPAKMRCARGHAERPPGLPPAAPSEAEESERSLAPEPCLPLAAPSEAEEGPEEVLLRGGGVVSPTADAAPKPLSTKPGTASPASRIRSFLTPKSQRS